MMIVKATETRGFAQYFLCACPIAKSYAAPIHRAFALFASRRSASLESTDSLP